MGFVIAVVAIHVGVWVMLFTPAHFEPPTPVRPRLVVTERGEQREIDLHAGEPPHAA